MNTVETLSRDISFYWQAVDLADYSDYSTKVGCIAAKGNKRIAGAVNRLRNPAKNVPYEEITYHAEFNVLQMLDDYDKVTLYIARLGKMGMDMPSRPCIRCMNKLYTYSIDEIVYKDKFNKIIKEKVR